ncbi:3-dehydroquinate synthase [Reinekea thalattae]|uniref:3-dehydroquinate synthase n=1 Tax=Reinekea thalattae TaxID=2593301 RepID=A0A5C8Z3W6_9GAMM|nr:3-dehydroquinate synthase [Reinekea thalattae]TXR51871.1 3-dehydroquinate synthase [Reinekea thalattae]
MKTLHVDLAERSYPIYIGECLSHESLILETLSHQEIVIVTNETVAPLYLDVIKRPLVNAGKKVAQVILPDGEKYKTLDTVNKIFDVLLAENFSRHVALVALGGGVIGDMTGFAAAAYQRGVDFVQIPTTLLSQVDSSVGGKTGVNHPLGKNMIGAFKQPLAVLIDPSTLKTLPEKEFSAGFAEVIKHGVIQSAEYFEFLEQNLSTIFNLDLTVLAEVIAGSCEIKRKVIEQDETEQNIRAILNLGHTFGHAIETTMGYGNWLHGQAVAAGVIMAADLSARLGRIDSALVQRIVALTQASGLPVNCPSEMTPDSFLAAMYRDKKVQSGTLRLVLINSLGSAEVTDQFDSALLGETLEHFCQQAKAS